MKWLQALFAPARVSTESKKKNQGYLVHDLSALYCEINKRYFEGKLALSIGWFGYHKPPSPVGRKVLGYFNESKKDIRIHRMLDSASFPPFFVSYVIYHEMLHSVERPKHNGLRRQIHHREFKRKEQQFHAYAEAKAWQRDHLQKILHGR